MSSTDTASADTATATGTTNLKTTLHYLRVGGELGVEELRERLEALARHDSRINVGKIVADYEGTGVPGCTLEFNCDGYAPPVNGNPDPQAVVDLMRLIGLVNDDLCIVFTGFVLDTLLS